MVILFQSTDFLTHAPTTSARLPFDLTGKVCLKSPPITTVIPPKVLPPTKSNEAIPDDATVSTTSPLNRQRAACNVFPVPALPFRKKENVLAFCRICVVVCPTGGLWIPISAWTVHHTLPYRIKEDWIFFLIWKFGRNKFVYLLYYAKECREVLLCRWAFQERESLLNLFSFFDPNSERYKTVYILISTLADQHKREQEEDNPKMNENGTMNEKLLVPYLPEEIIMEIHSRLPPNSLLKFSGDIYSIDNESSSSSLLVLDGMEKIPCPDIEYEEYSYDRTSFVGSCNGLVCIHFDDYSPTDFSLWNPSSGDYKRLPNPSDPFAFDDSLYNYLPVKALRGYGLCYDSKIDDYKFVCFTTDLHWNRSAVQIYSLRSDLWKQVKPTHNIPSLLSPKPYTPQYGVFCNGAIHWQSSSSSKAFISLCMKDELIREISPPENSNLEKFDDSKCIDVVDGCLSMLFSNVTLGLEVWSMKDYGKKESWTKIYSISKLTSLHDRVRWGLCLRRIKCLKTGEMLLEVRYNCGGPYQKALVLYNPKNEMSTTLIEDVDEWGSNSLSFHSYVKSSVSLSSITIAG